jgi:polar amino acid transport system substrate-binding protein
MYMKRLRLAFAAMAMAALLPFQSLAHGAAPVTPPSDLKTKGVLTIGTNMPYPPMESYTGANLNVPTGADIDLGTAIAGKMGLKVTFVNIPNFDTIIPGLQSHHYDIIMSSMGVTPDRAKSLDFVPYMLAGQSIVVARGNPKHINSLADLSGKTAGVQAATTEQASLDMENTKLKAAGKPLITVQTYKQDSDALAQLSLGRVDAYLTDFPVAAYYVSKRHNQLQLGGKQFSMQTYGIAIRKGDKPILTAVSKAFKLVQASGEYLTILKRYNLQQGAYK